MPTPGSTPTARTTQCHEVLFALPLEMAPEYFKGIYDHVERELLRSELKQIRPILRSILGQGDSADHQISTILQREVDWLKTDGKKLTAAVVAPTGAESFESDVVEFWHSSDGVPIIALSLGFKSRDLQGTAPPTVASTGNTACYELGKDAGKRLKFRHASGPFRIVLIEGDKKREDSRERTGMFLSGVISELNGESNRLEIAARLECSWRRAFAASQMETFLKENTGSVGAVFAANDEMAIGACMALQSYGVPPETTDVYGFDYITSVEARLNNRNEPYLQGSVSQGKRQMAEQIVTLLKDLLAHVESAPEVDWRDWSPTPLLPALAVPEFRKKRESVVPLFEGPDDWVSARDAGTIEGVSVSHLTQYRNSKKYEKGRSVGHDEQSKYGKDRLGRVWRVNPKGKKDATASRDVRILYLKRSLQVHRE